MPVLGHFQTALLAELRLGLPPLFYHRLVDIDDDWGFVLKLHALFEGTITKLITEKTDGRPEVQEILQPRDTFFRRVSLADRLTPLDADKKTFLIALNRLRNDITHNIRYLNFSLPSYVDNLSEREFRATAASLCVGFRAIPVTDALVSSLGRVLTGKVTYKDDSRKGVVWRYKRIGKEKDAVVPLQPASARKISTCREFFWDLCPRVALWQGGLSTLDLLSVQMHSADEDGVRWAEPELEAKLQDLLLDPVVIKYRRKLHAQFPEIGASEGSTD